MGCGVRMLHSKHVVLMEHNHTEIKSARGTYSLGDADLIIDVMPYNVKCMDQDGKA
jgi:hypothetical protein